MPRVGEPDPKNSDAITIGLEAEWNINLFRGNYGILAPTWWAASLSNHGFHDRRR